MKCYTLIGQAGSRAGPSHRETTAPMMRAGHRAAGKINPIHGDALYNVETSLRWLM